MGLAAEEEEKRGRRRRRGKGKGWFCRPLSALVPGVRPSRGLPGVRPVTGAKRRPRLWLKEAPRRAAAAAPALVGREESATAAQRDSESH